MGFNSGFKGLSTLLVAEATLHPVRTINCEGYGRKQSCSMTVNLNQHMHIAETESHT